MQHASPHALNSLSLKPSIFWLQHPGLKATGLSLMPCHGQKLSNTGTKPTTTQKTHFLSSKLSKLKACC